MARTKKQEPLKETATVVTRAEKKDATKNLIKECLAVKSLKHNELLEEVAKLYKERFGGEDTDNINDVKGRVGSVLDIMKKDGDVAYEGGMYALKARVVTEAPVQKEEKAVEKTPKKATKKTAKKVTEEAVEEEKTEEKPVKKPTKKAKATKKEPLPPAPIQPIVPVAPVTPEVAPEPIPEEKPAPKKRGRKAKAAEQPVAAEEKVEGTERQTEPQEKAETAEVIPVAAAPTPIPAPKAEVMDVSFLLGDRKPVKAEKREEPKTTDNKPQPKAEEKPVLKTERKAVAVKEPSRAANNLKRKTTERPVTADERLCEAFLKRIRTLGGDYFEYYSVYLLERYSMRNGRRLESLKISGGDHDGGIDGEIELTDKLGFKETIYIQSKNWNPEKGDEKLWVVGETLLQQFIGACACRQAKDKKQHCRGIFITTSRFTSEAKRILEDMSDKIVGYDGADLYEAAKECEFGVVKKNGEWALDEKLLSGTKAFFNML